MPKDDPTSNPLLSDRIRTLLSDEIMSGVLQPGQALDEQQLGDRFGASRTPVREALRQLNAANLVEIRPRRGAIVAAFTAERMVEMFEMSAEIEAMCVRLAAWRMSPAERSRLALLHDQSDAMVAAGDVDAYDRLNWQFHRLIYDGTHNSFMVEQAVALRDRMAAFRRTQLRGDGRLARSRGEHEGILKAIMRSEGDEAARCMRAHMINASIALARLTATRETMLEE